MALPDPQSVTLSVGVVSIPKIIDDGLKSVYMSADGTVIETISHQVTPQKRRTMIRIDNSKVAADPITSVNKSIVGSGYVVLEFPTWGFTEADKIALFAALNTQLSAGTNALLKRILGGEH
jgi:hypothetical protein